MHTSGTKKLRVAYVGGGTLGSVTPLLALHEHLLERKKIGASLWIGTSEGPERAVVEAQGISFARVHAGKIRRYFDWRNFVDPLRVILGFFEALWILIRFHPNVVIHAGSYVGVPVCFAAFALRVRIVIVQLDVLPGRANAIVMPFASAIAVATAASLRYFPHKKTVVTGIPVRAQIRQTARSREKEESKKRAQILVVGGGTGAQSLNDLVVCSLSLMSGAYDVNHITGPGKASSNSVDYPDWYHPEEFVSEGMENRIAAADIVISRAGMGMISELAAAAKPVLLLPLPRSPQEANARYFCERNAARCLDQEAITPEYFVQTIEELLSDSALRIQYGEALAGSLEHDACEKIALLLEKQA